MFFDVKLGRYGDATPIGRVVMEIKADVCPKTAEVGDRVALASGSSRHGGLGNSGRSQAIRPMTLATWHLAVRQAMAELTGCIDGCGEGLPLRLYSRWLYLLCAELPPAVPA